MYKYLLFLGFCFSGFSSIYFTDKMKSLIDAPQVISDIILTENEQKKLTILDKACSNVEDANGKKIDINNKMAEIIKNLNKSKEPAEKYHLQGKLIDKYKIKLKVAIKLLQESVSSKTLEDEEHKINVKMVFQNYIEKLNKSIEILEQDQQEIFQKDAESIVNEALRQEKTAKLNINSAN